VKEFISSHSFTIHLLSAAALQAKRALDRTLRTRAADTPGYRRQMSSTVLPWLDILIIPSFRRTISGLGVRPLRFREPSSPLLPASSADFFGARSASTSASQFRTMGTEPGLSPLAALTKW